MRDNTPGRRDFIKTAAGAVAALSQATSATSASSIQDANSKIRIRFIGPGGREGDNADVAAYVANLVLIRKCNSKMPPRVGRLSGKMYGGSK